MQGRANHFQAAVTGGALVGDNLGTALTLAGEDASYANLLFLLLGLPGLALAAVVAALVVALRSDRRRREFALLRLRGATVTQVVRMVAGESLAIAAVGAAIGIPLAWLAVGIALPGATPLSTGWVLIAVSGGVLLALATQAGAVLRLAVGRERTGVAAEAARARALAQAMAVAGRPRPPPPGRRRGLLRAHGAQRLPGGAGARGHPADPGELRSSRRAGIGLAGPGTARLAAHVVVERPPDGTMVPRWTGQRPRARGSITAPASPGDRPRARPAWRWRWDSRCPQRSSPRRTTPSPGWTSP